MHVPPDLMPWAYAIGGLLIVALLVWGWRRRKERHLHTDRLWRFPVVMTAIILPLLYLQPHAPFHGSDYGVFAVMVALGTATGVLRAYASSLRYDHNARRIMVSISASALLLLLPIGLMRQVSREYFGMGIDAVRHGDIRAVCGSLVFVLGMVIAYPVAMHIRARRLLRRHEERVPSP
ncbi:CcdC protein domain-containing protein [Sphingobium subterraneum]|uniref:4-amino-4-deoxy-L-arabinose transferase-like glycosyltransferase n=1 Tax=Sphingobium subterraneum TaxID=627688 RepID=A0A841J191_9SPHN|nr:CcdC protein domain-containing protein [Sphingobium subterraneum]MBB6124474.1 4-amino-4-deoxy-L-arabinose transferase-like glycosyltransferase [Sphingobium subterraneum]